MTPDGYVRVLLPVEYAWALGALLALGVVNAVWFGLDLGALVGRVLHRWARVRRGW